MKDAKIFFATDIHGSDVCLRKFLNAGKFYGVDAVVMGGDITGKMIVPNRSMCRMGFNVTRPSMRAVGSPQRDAIHACADSCTLIANRNAITWNT